MSDSTAALANEPDAPDGSLGVTAFSNPGVPAAIKQAVRLMAPGKRRLLVAASIVQISLGLLDLLGIALIGLVAAIAVSGIGKATSTGQVPTWAQSILDKVGLGDLSISQLSVIIALAAVIILVLKTVLSAFMSRRITFFLAHRQADLSTQLAREFLRRPLADVLRWTTSEATYALNNGASAATVSLLGSAIMIASETFLFVIVGISLLIYDPILTLTAGAFFGVIVLFLHRILGSWSARNAQVMTDTSINTLTAVSEALSTYRETMVLNRRDLYVTRYEGLVGTAATTGASNAFIMEVPKYVLEAALYLGVLVLGIVQFLTRDWAAAASTVAVFLAAGSRVIPAMLRLQGAGITIRNAAVQAQPTFFMADFLKERRASDPSPSGPRMTSTRIREHILAGFPDFEATIEVVDVSLTYSDAAEPAVRHASFLAPEGSSVALVGSTGAGKSTLADIVLGVLVPGEGDVRISGVTPREAIARWPGAITYVPQAVALVAGTVRENVALGLPDEDIDDELVWEALRRAHLADFLIDNREGLDTFVGERGFRLSGGQRQRLGIARALYTRPKLLVLDEATSALDSETEQAIIDTLAELEGEVTTLTVAHRLATIRMADQIIYLKDGRVEAKGNFDEVRAQVDDFDRPGDPSRALMADFTTNELTGERVGFDPKDVSAVVCTMNSISGIEACLVSLREAGVGQLVVVDAHSQDGTRRVAERLADVVLSDPGAGLGMARNVGIAVTTQPLILNMGSDNVMPPGQLEKMMAFKRNGSFDGVSAQTLIAGRDYLSQGLNSWRKGRFRPGKAAVIGTPTLFSGDVLREHPYDPSRRFSDDSELCERWERELGATFAISDAFVEEVGKTSWSELVVRCRMYGISDAEVFTQGRQSGWSIQRQLKSLTHPARVDFIDPITHLSPVDAVKSAPFLAAFAGMRYAFWVEKAIKNR